MTQKTVSLHQFSGTAVPKAQSLGLIASGFRLATSRLARTRSGARAVLGLALLVSVLSPILFASTANASWLVRLLTTPPELLSAAVQPDPEKMEQVANMNLVAALTSPRLPRTQTSKAPIGATPNGNEFAATSAETTLGTSRNTARSTNTASARATDTANLPERFLDNLLQPSGDSDFAGIVAPAGDLENALILDDLVLIQLVPESTITAGPPESILKRNVPIIDDGVFTKTLTSEGISKDETAKLVELIRPHYNLADIDGGTNLEMEIYRHVPAGEDGRLASLYFRPDSVTRVRVTRDKTGTFDIDATKRELKERWVMARGSLKEGSIWEDAKRYNIPERIVSNMVRAHRHTLDLNKMGNGDQFSVLFEATIDPKTGKIFKSGEILYTAIRYKGKKTGIYWFENGNSSNWFKGDGSSTRRGVSLSRKPIKSGRLSSNYGMRRHPVLKTRKMHWGTDYAAPSGTPIYAAGSGTVTFSGWKGGYGRYVTIRHNGTYSTAYAHMSKFGKGIKKGKRVSKGQVIGYVGTSGRSTGPHLHYEVMRNGKKINPLGKQVPIRSVLGGSTRAKFDKQKARIDGLISRALTSEQVSLR